MENEKVFNVVADNAEAESTESKSGLAKVKDAIGKYKKPIVISGIAVGVVAAIGIILKTKINVEDVITVSDIIDAEDIKDVNLDGIKTEK